MDPCSRNGARMYPSYSKNCAFRICTVCNLSGKSSFRCEMVNRKTVGKRMIQIVIILFTCPLHTNWWRFSDSLALISPASSVISSNGLTANSQVVLFFKSVLYNWYENSCHKSLYFMPLIIIGIYNKLWLLCSFSFVLGYVLSVFLIFIL